MWGNSEDVAAYIAAVTKTQEGTLQLLKSLVARSVSHQLGDAVVQSVIHEEKDIETLIPMDDLEKAVQAISTANVNEEDEAAIKHPEGC